MEEEGAVEDDQGDGGGAARGPHDAEEEGRGQAPALSREAPSCDEKGGRTGSHIGDGGSEAL